MFIPGWRDELSELATLRARATRWQTVGEGLAKCMPDQVSTTPEAADAKRAALAYFTLAAEEGK